MYSKRLTEPSKEPQEEFTEHNDETTLQDFLWGINSSAFGFKSLKSNTHLLHSLWILSTTHQDDIRNRNSFASHPNS